MYIKHTTHRHTEITICQLAILLIKSDTSERPIKWIFSYITDIIVNLNVSESNLVILSHKDIHAL